MSKEASRAVEDKSIPHFLLSIGYHKVCGIPFAGHFKKENILSAINFKPRDDDIIISSYPKTGTTWVQFIVLQILHRAGLYSTFTDIVYKISPYLELAGAEEAEKLESPRFIKFHLPYDIIPRSKSAKYIYTVRNPKDTVVSYYNFMRQMSDKFPSFDEYFHYFLSGELTYGDYFEHVLSWYEHRDEENILLVHYEELCHDIKSQILRIAGFLGECHLKALEEDSNLFEEILKETSFKYMKENLPLTVSHNPSSVENEPDEKRINFFRKGTSGDWRNHLTTEQGRLLDEKIQAKLGNTELISIWGNAI